MCTPMLLYKHWRWLCLLICVARVSAWGQTQANPEAQVPLRQPAPMLRRGIIPVPPPVAPQEDAPGTSERGVASPSESPHKPAGSNGHTVQSSFTAADLDIARAAWRYFGANHHSETGLFNAVHNYPFTTTWDMAGALAGLVAAE